MSLPVIDLAPFATGEDHSNPAAREQAAIIDATCQELGFLLAVGHGIAPETKEELLTVMREFFAQPQDSKRQSQSRTARAIVGMSELAQRH